MHMTKPTRSSVLILAILVAMAMLAACATTPSTPTVNPTMSPATPTPVPTEEPYVMTREWNGSFEFTFPAVLPLAPAVPDQEQYAYDDGAETYAIRVLVQGWDAGTMPPAEKDLTKQYLDEKFNIDLQFFLAPPGELDNMAVLAFADNSPYDVIWGYKSTAKTLADQELLVDARHLLQYMPAAAQYVTQDFAKWSMTQDGFMMGIPRYPTFPQVQNYFIRTDWLETFGMAMPKNPADLLEYARKVATTDPDGNSKADTWLGTGAAGGRSFGNLAFLEAAFGYPEFSVDANGKITHSIVNGTRKAFIEFLRTCQAEGLLAPDWYTAEGGTLETLVVNEQLGIVAYPMSVQFARQLYNAKNDMAVLDRYTPMEPIGPDGKIYISTIPSAIFLFPATLVGEEGKVKRIAHLIDSMIYPNEDYFTTFYGGGPTIFPEAEAITFKKYPEQGTYSFTFDGAKHPILVNTDIVQMWNYTNIGYTSLYEVYEDDVGKQGIEWDAIVNTFPRYTYNNMYLDLDQEKKNLADSVMNEMEIAFVLGEKPMSEWDAYVQAWLDAGGTDLLVQAAEQLGASSN